MRNISEGHCATAPGFDPLAKAEMMGFFRSIEDFEKMEADARRLLQELDARSKSLADTRTYLDGLMVKRRSPNEPPIPEKAERELTRSASFRDAPQRAANIRRGRKGAPNSGCGSRFRS
jgi:hypothetical protein